MSAITIPKSIQAAKARLGAIGHLLTATEWERAAIVYAFTEPADRYSHPKATANSQSLNLAAFARLGIQGLNREQTVAAYRKAWHDAILDGQATPVEPGERVELPTRDWPGNPDSSSGSVRTFRAQVKANPEAIRDLVGDDPKVAEAVADQVFRHPGLRHAVSARINREQDAFADMQRQREAGKVRYWDDAARALATRLTVPSLATEAQLVVDNADQLSGRSRQDLAATLRQVANQYLAWADALAVSTEVIA